MASFQVFADIENQNTRPSNARKSKRQGVLTAKANVVNPNKRAALGNITNTLGNRVQPSRAVKAREKASLKQPLKENAPFSIHVDVPPVATEGKESKNELIGALSCLAPRQPLSTISNVDSPMVIASPENSFIEIGSDEVRSAQIQDIDSQSDWSLDVREYANDIHNYLKKAELKHRCKPAYMKKQTDINCNMRMILIDWLVEVAEEYKLMPQTLYLTVNYIDRFLSCMSVIRGKLQLVGTACMLVAAKFEEIYPPEVSEFVYITDDTYTAKQVLRMEHLILKTLSFDVSIPTALNFVQRYLLAVGAEKDSKQEYLAKFLCELTLVQMEPYIGYLPSTIAASAVCVANYTLGLPTWTPTAEFYSGYQIEDLSECIRQLHTTFENCKSWDQQAVQGKYKSAKFQSVSSLTPPSCPVL